MPENDATRDWHRSGDFGDTSLDAVKSVVRAVAAPDSAHFHPGLIPSTFDGLADHLIALCHCDLDIYRSITDCCEFVYPRLLPGGVLLFDDYGLPTCAGARTAVDSFFRDKPEFPLLLQTGQAIVMKLWKN